MDKTPSCLKWRHNGAIQDDECFDYKVKMDFWEKNSTFGVLDIFTKYLCEKKLNVFLVYMPFKSA